MSDFVEQLLNKRQQAIELADELWRLGEEYATIAISLDSSTPNQDIVIYNTQKAQEIRKLLLKYSQIKTELENLMQ